MSISNKLETVLPQALVVHLVLSNGPSIR